VRVIDETGKQLGVMPLEEALRAARERNLDLVLVTERVSPPICKITDYGKYLYRLEKKEKSFRPKGGEMKSIRLTFGISDHDLEIRACIAEKFLEKNDKVKLEMVLRGREKALQEFAKEKIKKFLEAVNKSIKIKIEQGLKKEFGKLVMIISRE